VKTWLDGFTSPLIQDEGDSKLLKLRFDVSQYQPEEIVVKTVDNKLLVSLCGCRTTSQYVHLKLSDVACIKLQGDSKVPVHTHALVGAGDRMTRLTLVIIISSP
jgi:hypothetical protein